ncbi:hypothetical protein BN7_6379 [Wickerhamomyces ciferrii]|uniref:amidase n=1 Tax=Wickerhamomyces ciferrii (strain ATCC 14091 / BCRC 22168 / CBS 111 / JCM 3599 / NBRC 0793 / NRRL Y-1031 F-60-10) TaxID=1206466 RepID=K0KNH5_WICCF|nr:uncharacterized protein BN7_6379 [Wickerhamomyces ciferrii]CCH46780.1 hypothetical protein BN7_6379 [Wickerhamomyces ciferrii]
MTLDKYTEVYLPKIKHYRQDLSKQVEPYLPLIKNIDPSKDEHFNAAVEIEKLLSPKELKITGLTTRELIDKQLQNELTAVDIYNAFSKRGALAHIFTNCAMELFFPEGLERAQELDDYRIKNGGKLVGPFHGIPISLKELMKYKGKITNAGYVAFLDNIITNPDDESLTIKILRDQGAVFYIRTSQPQTVMHLDTQNNITGRTTNPFNTKISPGGSSGGEGAAVALKASVIGIGSDIGGSVRVPAAFCGIYGIRPTTKRLSGLGSLSGGAGQESIFATQGPMTNSIDDIDYYMDAYINKGKPWLKDPNIIPLEWKLNYQLDDTITFGFLTTDTIVDPSDSIKRGLSYVQDKLTKFTGKKCIVKTINLDHELMENAYKQNKQIYGTSKPTHDEILNKSEEPILPLTQVFLNFANENGNNILTNNIVKEQTKLYFHQLFENESLDFIIGPTFTNVAEVPDNITHWFYSSMFNLIDFPNIVFKTGLTHDSNVDLQGPSNMTNYNPNDYINAPIGLQLTAKRFEDEKLVACVRLLDEVLGL